MNDFSIRALANDELELVSGGGIPVPAPRPVCNCPPPPEPPALQIIESAWNWAAGVFEAYKRAGWGF